MKYYYVYLLLNELNQQCFAKYVNTVHTCILLSIISIAYIIQHFNLKAVIIMVEPLNVVYCSTGYSSLYLLK
jgi:hypothetical protein